MTKFYRPWYWKAQDSLRENLGQLKFLGYYGLLKAYYERKRIKNFIKHSVPVIMARGIARRGRSSRSRSRGRQPATPPASSPQRGRSMSRSTSSKRSSRSVSMASTNSGYGGRSHLRMKRILAKKYRKKPYGKGKKIHNVHSYNVSNFPKGKRKFAKEHLSIDSAGWKSLVNNGASTSGQKQVFMTHTVAPAQIVRTVFAAMFRKGLKKAFGLEITSEENKVWPQSIGVAAYKGFYIELALYDTQSAGISVPWNWDSTANDSFGELVDKFITWFNTYTFTAQGFIGTDNDKLISSLNYYIVYNSGGDVTILQHNQYLRNTYISFEGYSELNVQNISKARDLGAGAVDVEVDTDIARVTLTGKKYLCNGVPSFKTQNMASLNCVEYNSGLKVNNEAVDNSDPAPYETTAATLTISPNAIQNCKAACGLYVDPGNVKKTSIYITKKMSLMRFIQYIRQVTPGAVAGPYLCNRLPYYTEMLSFVPAVDWFTGTTSKVSIAYMHRQVVRANCYEKKRTTCFGTVISSTAA